MASRMALPRKPAWLDSTPGRVSPEDDGQRRGADTTARVLEFPATSLRPATAAATRRQPGAATGSGAVPQRSSPTQLRLSQSSMTGSVGAAKATATIASTAVAGLRAGGGSTALAPEPAYRSALSRLSARPKALPTPASGLPAAPSQLPSSRLDALLARRPCTAAAGPQAPRQQAAIRRPTLDELLQRPATRPSSAASPAATLPPPPLPSSRLDQLLALRPADSVAGSMRGEQHKRGSGSIGGSAPSLSLSLSRGAGTRGPPALAAAGALSPVDESPATASRASTAAASLAALSARAASPQLARPTAPASGGRAGLAATAAAAAPTAILAPAPVAAPAVAPSIGADPALQDRLRERIELAKAQIRQQLSPMFRLSEALAGAEQDPQRAADALDAATGLSLNGFELLARRPGSRGAGSSTCSSGINGGRSSGGGASSGSAACSTGLDADAAAAVPPAGQQQHSRPGPPSGRAAGWAEGAARQAHGAGLAAGTGVSGDADVDVDVDSLVANARAAAARAQSALADLASPPRQHATLGMQPRSATSGADSAAGAATCSAPRAAAPVPYGTQALSAAADSRVMLQQVQPLEEEAGQLLAVQPLPVGADLQLWVGDLRQQAETLIRSECEKLVASIHFMFDGFLDTLPHQQADQEGSEEQRHYAAAAGRASSSDQAGIAMRGNGTCSVLPCAPEADAEEGALVHDLDESATAGSSRSSPQSAGHAYPWPGGSVDEQAEQLAPLEGEEEEPEAEQEWGAGGSQPAEAADFAPQLQQQQHHQGERPEEPGGAPLAAAGSRGSAAGDDHSLPHRQQQWQPLPQQLASSFGLSGFGSPIRLAPSPAKPAASSKMGRQLGAAAGGGPSAGLQHQQQQAELGTAVRSLSLGGRRLVSPAGQQATPVFGTPVGGRASTHAADGPGDGFLTARSMAAPPSCSGGSSSSAGSGDFFDSPRSPSGSEGHCSIGGGGGGISSSGAGWPGLAAPVPAAVAGGCGRRAEGQPAALLLGAGQRDLDSLVGSIQKMAAEIRLKHGALATSAAGGCKLLQDTGAGSGMQQSSVSASRLFLTPAGSSSVSGGGGSGNAGGSRSSFRPARTGPVNSVAPSSSGSGASPGGGLSSVRPKPPR